MRNFIPAALILSSALPLWLSGCATDSKPAFDSPSHRGPASAPIGTHVDRLSDPADFKAMSIESDSLVAGGRSVKFLIDKRGSQPIVHFLNGNYVDSQTGKVPDYVKYHYYFAQHELGMNLSVTDFNNSTYFTPSIAQRSFIAGTVQTYQIERNGQTVPFYGIQFYPQDIISEQMIVYALTAVRQALVIPNVTYKFVAYGAQQTTASVATNLSALGLEPLAVDQIIGSARFLPMNLGEAWGHLRVFPSASENLSPDMLPIFNELPLDLSVVSGVITFTVQTPNSHINLKSKERGTPNLVLRDMAYLQNLKSTLEGKPVHLVVARDHFTLEPSDEATVQAKLVAHRPTTWKKITIVDRNDLLDYDAMCTTSPVTCLPLSQAYGGKSAKLGFLASRGVIGAGSPIARRYRYRLTPLGFGIPLHFYADFLKQNPDLTVKIEKLSALEMQAGGSALTPDARAAAAKEIQELFYHGKFPAGALESITAAMQKMTEKVTAAYPGITLKKIKIRSSANVEDIPDFDGAGLHDSFGAKLNEPSAADQDCALDDGTHDRNGNADDSGDVTTKTKMKPPSVACAIKGVYASLWNSRAIEERSYKGIDHTTARMGISVLPAYDFRKSQGKDLTANSVVVTRVINSSSIFGYTASNQVGDNLVTNPDPGTHAEVAIIAAVSPDDPPSISYLQHAKPVAGQPEITTPAIDQKTLLQIREVSNAVEIAYCKAKPGYYSGSCGFVAFDATKPTSLDMEFKVLGVTGQTEILCKQVREFSGK